MEMGRALDNFVFVWSLSAAKLQMLTDVYIFILKLQPLSYYNWIQNALIFICEFFVGFFILTYFVDLHDFFPCKSELLEEEHRVSFIFCIPRRLVPH